MEIIIFLFVLSAGIAAGYFFRRTLARRDAETAEAKVDKIITEAKESQREIIIEGKNKALEILEKEPVIAMDCQFCGASYQFTRSDIQNLFDLDPIQ